MALVGFRGYFKIYTLNEFLVFDQSLAIWSIRTNQLRANSYGHSTSWYQPKPS